MNKINLKRYAPQARKDFIAAVTARAQLLGLTDVAGQPYAEPCQVNGDVAVIAGRAWPASVQGKRERLLQRMMRDGYAATLDAVAYTWFNRFAALRYMELHDYLGHGRRVLSNPDGALPEILSHALELAESGDLPGLQAEHVRQLKLDNQDGELFRRVLISQCNALHGAMPFLFEAINDETELLLPDNLLLSDSVIAKLVSEIPEEDWTEVEVIGWLYQFYISEKKDLVTGKVVKSEDIPAATQLFTPNWIVQYLVQNSVGRLWLMANPQSTLAQEWPYYITPADQTPEVQGQLDALIQTRVQEDGDMLNPESITVLDPACGSGHILVVAYDVLKAIYLERGYQLRAIPRLILEKNLFGLDIDDRAAQMAGFALLMKARADDRRLFSATDEAGNLQPPKLNVLSLQESKGLSVNELAIHLEQFNVQRNAIAALVETFEHAKTFGSLIQIPAELSTQLEAMTAGMQKAFQNGDLYAQQAAKDIRPLLLQASILGGRFDVAAANPPYLAARSFNTQLKAFVKEKYWGADKDLFSAFIAQCYLLSKPSGHVSIMTSFVWMFISSFERLRSDIVRNRTITTLVQLEYDAFEDAKAHICAFTTLASHIYSYDGGFVRLADFKGAQNQGPRTLEAIRDRNCGWFYTTNVDNFLRIPGNPIAYWISERLVRIFESTPSLSSSAKTCVGLQTGDNGRFVRYWYEVDRREISLNQRSRAEARASGRKWFPYNKGGDYRRWYGNQLFVVNWKNDGEEISSITPSSVIRNSDTYFLPSVSWAKIGSTLPSFRYYPSGFIYDVAGTSLFAVDENYRLNILGFCNSVVATSFLQVLSPTINFEVGQMAMLPVDPTLGDSKLIDDLVNLSKQDWDGSEYSMDFNRLPFLRYSHDKLLSVAWQSLREFTDSKIAAAIQMEEKNNRCFIEEYGLHEELSPEVPESQVTLARADREKDSQRLISYAIGCMMGRYSLDEPGLIYAHAGNVGFEPGRYTTFAADADGIVPITDELWFADDACSRIREFLRAVWGQGTLDENMAWLAESLGTKASETPDETVRRYIADKFFKDHLQTYKKRPIYWLFSSGKHGAFQALVYLHRYHEGTLARMRSEYVLPLTGKMQARMESLDVDIRQASSTAARSKLTKQLDALRKQHHELLAYDEKLRHYADQRLSIDLDDGVKVNYGKFGDLLAEVKTVTGGSGDE